MKAKHRAHIQHQFEKSSPAKIAEELGLKERTVRKYIDQLKRTRADSEPGPSRIRLSAGFWLGAALTVLLSAAVYFNTLRGEFIWDDVNLVQNNPFIRDWKYLPKILTENLGIGIIQTKSSSYRPLQTLTYMIDFHFWELNVFGYHLTNILWHAFCALGVFATVFLVLRQTAGALIASALFAVHPVHTEAVAYISGRADPLAGTFVLLSFACYLIYLDRGARTWFILMMGTFIASLLCRESAVLNLLILILAHRLTLGTRWPWSVLGGISLISVIYTVLRSAGVLGPINPLGGAESALIDRLPGFLAAYWEYARLLVWPTGLHMEYGRPLIPWSDPRVSMGAFLLAATIAGIVLSRKKRPVVAFGLLWYLLSLLPVSNVFIEVNAFMAEHWLYLPSIGIVLIAGWAGGKILEKGPAVRWIPVGITIGAVAVFSVLTVRQNRVWQDPVRFFENILKYAPTSSRVHADLGVVYYNRGRLQDARRSFERAIELNPGYAYAYNNLGAVYNNLGDISRAVASLKTAINLQPGYDAAHYNLGLAYKALGRCDDAVTEFRNAIRINRFYTQAYNNLGVCLNELKQYSEAREAYRAALRLDPGNLRVVNNVATSHRDSGNIDEAIRIYREALRLNGKPGDRILVWQNLGLAYKEKGDSRKAAEAFREALALRPDFRPALRELDRMESP